MVESRSTGVKGENKDFSYTDQRAAASFVLYPKPFGIQAEYNVGIGPEFNPINDSIQTQELKGGYVTASWMIILKKQLIIPFARWHYYDGGKKHELDARSYTVNEYEFGIEWQPIKNFEFEKLFSILK